jgi:uncharacterized protein (TIGR00251 family)
MPLSLTGRGRVRLALKLCPNSRREGLDGVRDGRLQIRLAAPAVEGKANAALVSFLARLLGVKKTQVLLVSGEKARQKIVEIEGATLEQVRERLELAAASGGENPGRSSEDGK